MCGTYRPAWQRRSYSRRACCDCRRSCVNARRDLPLRPSCLAAGGSKSPPRVYFSHSGRPTHSSARRSRNSSLGSIPAGRVGRTPAVPRCFVRFCRRRSRFSPGYSTSPLLIRYCASCSRLFPGITQHRKHHRRLANRYMAEFEPRRLASANRMDVTQISDAAMSSNFQTPRAFDTWLHRSFGADMKLLTFAQRHARRTVELCPLQGEGYVYLADLCFLNQAPRMRSRPSLTRDYASAPTTAMCSTAWTSRALVRPTRRRDRVLGHAASIRLGRISNKSCSGSSTPECRPACCSTNWSPEWQTLRKVWDQYCRSGTPEDLTDLLSYASEMAPLEIANEQSPVRPAYVWYRLASMNADVGRVDESLGCLERADECDPAQYAIRFASGKTLIAVGRLPEAEPHVRWCLTRRPGDKNLSDALLVISKHRLAMRTTAQATNEIVPTAHSLRQRATVPVASEATPVPAIQLASQGIMRSAVSLRVTPTGRGRRGLFCAICRFVLWGFSAPFRRRTAVLGTGSLFRDSGLGRRHQACLILLVSPPPGLDSLSWFSRPRAFGTGSDVRLARRDAV